MEHLHHYLESIGALITVLIAFSKWIFRWVTRININHKFTTDMATNHLPHLYRGQRQIAKKLGVELDDDPIIQFVEINGKH